MSYVENMFSLKGKTAVVTGGGGVLCSIMGTALANAGANVILWDIRKEALDDKVKVVSEKCGDADRVSSVVVDLMSEESVKNALEESAKIFGQVDILVNGAGGNKGKSGITDMDMNNFEFVLKLNLLAGCIVPVKYFSDYWIKNKIPATIINVSSMAGFNPLSGVYAYSAAKSAVMNQTIAQAKELAPYKIRVNSIAPGFFVADQNRALLLNDDGTPTQRGKDVLAHTPFNRFGDPKELSGAVVFLASDQASGFISGVNLPIDGAYLAFNI